MVAKTCVLHIGCEKTGTSSLQIFLMKNRAVLRKMGYLYPTTAGGPNHRFISAAFVKDPKMSNYAGDMNVDEFFESFKSEMLEAGEDKVIISNEHLHSRLRKQDEVLALKDFLCSCGFENFRVLAYLRRQDELLVSAYSEAVKQNSTKKPDFLEKKYYADYAAILQLWSSVFGVSNITVKVYDRNKMLLADVRHDFLNVLGIADTSEFEWTERVNPSLGAAALEFKRLFNRYFDNATPIPRQDLLNALLNAHKPDEDKQVIDFETRLRILETYRPSNEYVAREFLGCPVDELFSPPQREDYEGAVMTELDAEKAIEISAHIWRSLHATNKWRFQENSRNIPAKKTVFSLRHYILRILERRS